MVVEISTLCVYSTVRKWSGSKLFCAYEVAVDVADEAAVEAAVPTQFRFRLLSRSEAEAEAETPKDHLTILECNTGRRY